MCFTYCVLRIDRSSNAGLGGGHDARAQRSTLTFHFLSTSTTSTLPGEALGIMEGNTVEEAAPGMPLPSGEGNRFLEQPRASFLDSNTGNSINSTPNNSSPLLATNKAEADSLVQERQENPREAKRRRPLVLALAGLAILAIVVLAVILPVYFTIIKPKQDRKNNNDASASSSPGGIGSGTGNPASPTGATTGGNGSQIITDTNTTFTYINNFGGYCELLTNPSFFVP